MDILIIAILLLVIIIEIVMHSVLGGFITKPIDVTNLTINPYSKYIMSNNRNLQFASKQLRYSLLSKWYINEKGRVLRFSKLHNQLEKKYKELKNDSWNI